MADGAPILSDAIKTEIDGKDYYTITSTKVTQGNDGKVNGGETTILYSPKPNVYIAAATTKDGGKTWTYAKYKQGDDIPDGKKVGDEIFGTQAKKSLESGALKTNTNQQVKTAATKAGIPPEQQNLLTLNQNTANPTGDPPAAAGGLTSGSTEDTTLKDATSKYRGRQTYSHVKYPEDLKSDQQDCIKFTIIKYNPSTLASSNTSQRNVGFLPNKPNSDGTTEGTNRIILGSITLPIPGNITDRNDADWSKSDISVINQAMADATNSFLVGGAEAGKNAAEKGVKSIANDKNILTAVIAAKVTEGTLGSSANVLARQYGAVPNPNAELLFNGPSLRGFSFTFKMSPRGPKEAKDVRTIIRYFKQAMSVKRTESVLLLKSPHTFAISYLTGKDEHPYLNKFKECALTSCSVNYTPYGSYMTYGKKKEDNRTPDIDTHSMVAYELTLGFQELEPVFDDDYGDGDKIPTEIGY
jgi:hypothetical protein